MREDEIKSRETDEDVDNHRDRAAEHSDEIPVGVDADKAPL